MDLPSSCRILRAMALNIVFFALTFSTTLAEADHIHYVSQIIQSDPTLQDLSYDVLGVIVNAPVGSPSDDYLTSVSIEDVFRGREEKGSEVRLRFRELRSLDLAFTDEIRLKAHLINPQSIKVGDRIIVCVEKGDPLTANSAAVYTHNSATEYQITVQMAQESFIARHKIIVGCLVAFLLVLLFKNYFRARNVTPSRVR